MEGTNERNKWNYINSTNYYNNSNINIGRSGSKNINNKWIKQEKDWEQH